MCVRPRPEPIYIPGSRTHQRTERPRCSRQDPAGATVAGSRSVCGFERNSRLHSIYRARPFRFEHHVALASPRARRVAVPGTRSWRSSSLPLGPRTTTVSLAVGIRRRIGGSYGTDSPTPCQSGAPVMPGIPCAVRGFPRPCTVVFGERA